MERKFYTEGFEDLLKESADEFKLQPSKKVWHGIYNDLHPGTRWPSIAMSLIFIFTLVIVGHLNTQQGRHTSISTLKKDTQLQKNVTQSENGNTENANASDESKNNSFKENQLSVKDNFTSQNLRDKKVEVQDQSSSKQVNKNDGSTAFTATMSNEKKSEDKGTSLYDYNIENQNNLTDKNKTGEAPPQKLRGIIITNPNKIITPNSESINSTLNPDLIKADIINADIKKITAGINSSPKNENAHIPILKLKPRRISKTNLTFYLSPSVSYRTYSKQHDKALQGTTLNVSNADMNRSVTHNVSPGFEIGTALKYSMSKKLRFTSGFQVNYSAYKVQANNIHPINATLILYNNETNLPYPVSTISYFGNGPGVAPVNLRNYSLQLSIPIGVEYVLAGNDNLQLNAAASFQPSYVLANQAYILSTDKFNYITQPSLSRRWNMGTNIGTFISFNSNRYKWEIGPQVHYQLLSSYSNEYHVREHFIDYGIRLGISGLIK